MKKSWLVISQIRGKIEVAMTQLKQSIVQSIVKWMRDDSSRVKHVSTVSRSLQLCESTGNKLCNA